MGNEPSDASKLPLVIEVLARLRAAGYEAWLNGGCVRDHLLGRTPADFDVATSAPPDAVEAIFPRSIAVGKAFGVIRVPMRGAWFEVATFRKDGVYRDGRRPDSVTFSSAEEDARRRDFTINGMFWDPVSGRILDFVGGREDLKRGVVRAIGDPDARIAEDSLRILRAVRFAAKDGFVLDPATKDAVVRHRARLADVAAERIREELFKMAAGTPTSRGRAIRLLHDCRLVEVVLPAAAASDAEARARVAEGCPKPSLALFLAALLGDALPFDARPPRWRTVASDASRRVRLSNEEARELDDLLACRVRMRGAARAPRSRQTLIATAPHYAHARMLLLAEGGAQEVVAALDAALERAGGVRPAPPIDGTRLLELGVPPRKAVGAWLRRLLILRLAGKVNSAMDAEDFVRRRLKTGS